MKIKNFNNITDTDLKEISLDFLDILKKNIPILLHGDLGMGKTTFVKHLLSHIGYRDLVTSPTFSLVHTYETSIGPVHHFDLYRIEKEEDLFNIGFYDVLHHEPVIIEWPKVLIQPCVAVHINPAASSTTRNISVHYA
jgi:tRNA threonylcarbamoyladenosine biosynthesis protein TsaE